MATVRLCALDFCTSTITTLHSVMDAYGIRTWLYRSWHSSRHLKLSVECRSLPRGTVSSASATLFAESSIAPYQ